MWFHDSNPTEAHRYAISLCSFLAADLLPRNVDPLDRPISSIG
jgi:hypothetical protein